MGLDSSCCRLTFAPPKFAAHAMIHRPTTSYYTLLLAYLLQTPPLHSYTPSSRSDQITVANSPSCAVGCLDLVQRTRAYSTPIFGRNS